MSKSIKIKCEIGKERERALEWRMKIEKLNHFIFQIQSKRSIRDILLLSHKEWWISEWFIARATCIVCWHVFAICAFTCTVHIHIVSFNLTSLVLCSKCTQAHDHTDSINLSGNSNSNNQKLIVFFLVLLSPQLFLPLPFTSLTIKPLTIIHFRRTIVWFNLERKTPEIIFAFFLLCSVPFRHHLSRTHFRSLTYPCFHCFAPSHFHSRSRLTRFQWKLRFFRHSNSYRVIMRLYFHFLIFCALPFPKKQKPIYAVICSNMCAKIHYMDLASSSPLLPCTHALNQTRIDVMGFM